jgi:hypothetical protein
MSEIRTNLLSDAAGTGPAGLFKQSAAKAWANIEGAGTVSIRQSFNVSSLVDIATGDYTTNYSSAFSSSNYSLTAAGGVLASASARNIGARVLNAGSTRLHSFTDAGVLSNGNFVLTAVHGDLA